MPQVITLESLASGVYSQSLPLSGNPEHRENSSGCDLRLRGLIVLVSHAASLGLVMPMDPPWALALPESKSPTPTTRVARPSPGLVQETRHRDCAGPAQHTA